MPASHLHALLSVVAISLLSFTGASVLALGPARVRVILPWLVALAAGALIGNVFLHLLPEAVNHMGGFTAGLGWWVLGGLVGFFAVESVIHWHHHGEDVHDTRARDTDHARTLPRTARSVLRIVPVGPRDDPQRLTGRMA